MEQINAAAFWFVMAGALWALVFLLLPLCRLRTLLLPGFLAGFAWTYILNYPAVNWLKLWSFHGTLLAPGKVPLALALAWYAEIVLFYFLVLSYPRLRTLLVFLAALMTAAVFQIIVALGHFFPQHWTAVEASFLGLISHAIALRILRVFFPRSLCA